VTLEKLLDFYEGLGSKHMKHFDPSKHRTADVVRQTIIPMSSGEKASLAQVLMDGQPTRASKMVTHNWANLFRDLIAAVLADALGSAEFGDIAELLDRNQIGKIRVWLQDLGKLHDTYWICAFAVNQHSVICGGNPYGDKDPVLNIEHPTCSCGLDKKWNTMPPTIKVDETELSIPCEVNKFDDMMKLLAASDPNFEQVVAIDSEFNLFTRAWCVAELVAAHEMGLRQNLKLQSQANLQDYEDTLKKLDIRKMQASRKEDVDEILRKIDSPEDFNEELRNLLLNDLIPAWKNIDTSVQVERIDWALRRAMLQAGEPDAWEPSSAPEAGPSLLTMALRFVQGWMALS